MIFEGIATIMLIIGILLLILGGFGGVGARVCALVAPGVSPAPEYYPLLGWSLAVLLMLVPGGLMPHGVQLAMGVFIVCGGLLCLLPHPRSGVALRQPRLPLRWLCGVFLTAPLLMHLVFFQPEGWDDFSHWLPNALYLFKHGTFPRYDSGDVYSYWPGYPYALALITASTSWLAGNFAECCGSLLNLMLIVLLAAFVAGKMAGRLGNPAALIARQRWVPSACFTASITLVFLLAALTFNRFIIINSNAEVATSVVLAFLFYCGGDFIADRPNRTLHGLVLALLAVLFVQIKQVNFYLLLLAMGSLWLCAKNKSQLLLPLALAVLPALLVQLGWEGYKRVHMPGRAFSLFGKAWHGDSAGFMLNSMAQQVQQNSGFFALLLGLVVLACASACTAKAKKGGSRFSLLLRGFALTTLGYYGFLCLAYLGSNFTEAEVRDATGFIRYASHLGFTALMLLLLGFARLLRRAAVQDKRNGHPPLAKPDPLLRLAGLAALFALPLFALAFALSGLTPKRSDRAIYNPAYFGIMEFTDTDSTIRAADRIFRFLPTNARVVLAATHPTGLERAIINYRWALQATPLNHPMVIGRLDGIKDGVTPEQRIATIKATTRADAALIPPPASHYYEAAAWQLWVKQPGGWGQVNPFSPLATP